MVVMHKPHFSEYFHPLLPGKLIWATYYLVDNEFELTEPQSQHFCDSITVLLSTTYRSRIKCLSACKEASKDKSCLYQNLNNDRLPDTRWATRMHDHFRPW